MGLADNVTFAEGSADKMGFGNGEFDAAAMLHVGMNIEGKAGMFAEVKRVLKPDGLFIIYDVMRMQEGELAWPLPWSSSPATSFVVAPKDYREALVGAGFAVVEERDMMDVVRGSKAPPPSILTSPAALANMGAMLKSGVIAPVLLVAKAVQKTGSGVSL